jgi:cation transport regulator ChaB
MIYNIYSSDDLIAITNTDDRCESEEEEVAHKVAWSVIKKRI